MVFYESAVLQARFSFSKLDVQVWESLTKFTPFKTAPVLFRTHALTLTSGEGSYRSIS